MNWKELNTCTDERLKEKLDDCWTQINMIKTIQASREYDKGEK